MSPGRPFSGFGRGVNDNETMKLEPSKLTCELLLGVMTLISGAGVGLHWVFGCCHPQLVGEIHCALLDASSGLVNTNQTASNTGPTGPAIADAAHGDDCSLCQLLSQFHAPKIQRSELVLPLAAFSAPAPRSTLLTPRPTLRVPPARGPPIA
jgi:hypothetical protein